MKYARYLESGRPRIGMVDAEKATLRPLEDRTGNLIDLIDEHPEGPKTTPEGGQPIALERVKLMAPIIPPRNIFCVGKNYRIHAKEFAGSGFERAPSRARKSMSIRRSLPPRFLKGGDEVTIEIQGIGTLKNRFA